MTERLTVICRGCGKEMALQPGVEKKYCIACAAKFARRAGQQTLRFAKEGQ